MLQKRFRSIRAAGRRGFAIVAFSASGLAFFAGLACNDELVPGPPGPRFNVGVIEGRIRIAGKPTAIGVGARILDSPGTLVAQTRSDSSGFYRLALQPGTYRIELNPNSGVGYTSGDLRDTVFVAAGIRHLDVFRGTLTVRLAVPPAANGQRFSCALEPSGPLSNTYGDARGQNSSLEFVFQTLIPGAYRMRIEAGSGPYFWLPGTSDVRAADQVIVNGLHSTVYEGRLGYASISGTVRGSWQEAGASSPRITAYSLASVALGATFASSDGSFALALVDVQPLRLQVSISRIDRWVGGDSFESATTFHPQRGDHIEGVSVVEGGILCTLEGPGALAAYRAQVLLLDSAGHPFAVDPSGENPISICNLAPGPYKLYVHGDCDYDGEPWASQWYDGADSLAAATPIEVQQGHVTRVTMHLDPDGRIQGRVLDAAGVAVPFRIVLYQDGALLCGDARYTSASGFSLRGLGNGDYTLAAPFQDFLWWYPGTAFADSARILSIRHHATLSGIEWRLPPLAARERP